MFRKLREELAGVGIRLRDDEDSAARLSELRSLYEPYVNALGWYLVMKCRRGRPSGGSSTTGRRAWSRAGSTPRHFTAASGDPIDDDH